MFLLTIMPLLLGLLVACVGAGIAFSPVEMLLKIDSQTGQAIFRREMERSGDRSRALRAAGRFYRWFGGFVMVFGIAWTVPSLIELVPGPTTQLDVAK